VTLLGSKIGIFVCGECVQRISLELVEPLVLVRCYLHTPNVDLKFISDVVRVLGKLENNIG
jgi:hypothetical protein